MVKRKTKKQIKKRNRGITVISSFIIGYILLVNNSLDFLIKFGINVNQNAVAFLAMFIVFVWIVWKAQNGEL